MQSRKLSTKLQHQSRFKSRILKAMHFVREQTSFEIHVTKTGKWKRTDKKKTWKAKCKLKVSTWSYFNRNHLKKQQQLSKSLNGKLFPSVFFIYLCFGRYRWTFEGSRRNSLIHYWPPLTEALLNHRMVGPSWHLLTSLTGIMTSRLPEPEIEERTIYEKKIKDDIWPFEAVRCIISKVS